MRRRSPALLSQADTTQKRNAPQTIRNRDAVSVIAPASGRSSGPSGKQNGRQFQSQNCAREARSARNGHLQRSRHEIDSDCSYARNSRTDFSPFPEVSAGLENSALNSVSAFRRRRRMTHLRVDGDIGIEATLRIVELLDKERTS